MTTEPRTRAHFIGAPEFFNLNQACRAIVDAFDWNVYLVGSSMKKRDFRDVDIRCILDDDEFDKLFPGVGNNTWTDAKWSLLCSSISAWLKNQTNLPIDFQFQRRTNANAEYSSKDGHLRNALGVFLKKELA